MNNIRKSCLFLGLAFAITYIFLFNTEICNAAGETYDTALEAAYGDTFKSVYENRLFGSPIEASEPDGVDTATGHLVITRNDLSLEGMAGMDLELNRYYDSNEANLGHATVEHINKLEINTLWVNYTGSDGKNRRIVCNADIFKNHKKALKDLLVKYEKGEGRRGVSYDGKPEYEENTQRTKIINNEGHNVYGIAAGWKYDFPWIETVEIVEDEGWGKNPKYLHYGSIGVINIDTEADESTKTYSIKGFEDYDYKDLKLEDFDKTVDGISCRYLLRDKTGLRTYFNEDGVIVLQKDAHNNSITFTYTDGIYFDKITDSVGREIVFNYSNDEDGKVLKSVSVQGEEAEGGVSKKEVTYETEEKTYTPHYGERLSGVILTSATVDGSKETYNYKTVERLVNTAGAGIASQRVSTDQSFLLTQVTSFGNEHTYEYRACSLRGTRDAEAGQERDVVTENFYVTREYEKDVKTGKKSNGIKYDYFQKKGDGALRSFDDFREREKKEDGSQGTIYESWQYGNSDLRTVTVVSSFNPNIYTPNGKYYDYKYEKPDINSDTLRLKNDTNKSVTLYIYNENKLLTDEVNYGEEKEETLYTYDKNGEGSLVVLETEKSYGKNGSGFVSSKIGYTYDAYRNILTEKMPKAYLAKNKGKEHLYTTIYQYKVVEGYPTEDKPFISTLEATESYLSAFTGMRTKVDLANNGVDYASISSERSINGSEYKIYTRTDYLYDSYGNQIQSKIYPSYCTDGTDEIIQNDYTFNTLGQQTKKSVTIHSKKRPQDNRSYVEEETVYDSFGNELSYTDERGTVTKIIYDEKTGDEIKTVNSAGTEYETDENTYISSDGLKTMMVDHFGRVTIDIHDAFGNSVIIKDEAAGTWTERIYEYGNAGADDVEIDEDDENESNTEFVKNTQLLEERTYAFVPDEKKFIINDNGEKTANFFITGRGEEVLRGTKFFYDNLGKEIGSADFSGGELNAAHCVSWNFSKTESEVTGEDENARTILMDYNKTLDPRKFQSEIDTVDYYNQFDAYVLNETITEDISDNEGNLVSKKITATKGKNKSKSVTKYDIDDFGRRISEDTITRSYREDKWRPFYENMSVYTYDDNGNVCLTENKYRKEGDENWITQTVKADYNDLGQIVGEYTPRGVNENVCTKFTYDILGRMIKIESPQSIVDGKVIYQTIEKEYDNTGNLIKQEEQIDDTKKSTTEYTYDSQGNLCMVKNCIGEDKEQYAQYVYDIQGNKVRQFTGMTSPLTIAVSNITDDDDYNSEVVKSSKNKKNLEDTFSFMGKKYSVTISGNKYDDIREVRYEYDGKNRLVSYTDPEGRTETYIYDVNDNLIQTNDKNGNIIKNTYDYRNRITKILAKDKKTEKETIHTYTYDSYGNIATKDDISFTYDDISGQVTKETVKLNKNKDIVKNYSYDSAGNKSSFSIKIAGETKLELKYYYDGASRLAFVSDQEDNKVIEYNYDTDGNLSIRTVPENCLKSFYAYDYYNHLLSLKNNKADGNIISTFESKYLLNGQKCEEIQKMKDEKGDIIARVSTYNYDLMGRITKVTNTGYKDVSYTYDNNNNRKEMMVGNKKTAYKYNKNDELLRIDTLNTETYEDSIATYKYDKNGNSLATINRNELPENMSDEIYIDIDTTLGSNILNENVVNHYNSLNQLTQTFTKKYKVNFSYDADGLRTEKTVSGEKTIFVWDGEQLVMELSGTGEVKKRYIRGNDLVYADKGEDTEKLYYYTDSHGNVVQLIDENGNIIKTYEYDAFGNEENPDSNDDNPFRYCGEYYDKEIDGIYLRARYYQPKYGRFLTRDIYTGENDNPESLHLYNYCRNDGVNAWDPSGHKEVDWTNKLNKAMRSHAEDFANYIKKKDEKVAKHKFNPVKKINNTKDKWTYFYNKVKTGGDWDLKSKKKWKFKKNNKYYYDGMKLRHDDPGNIHFGYVGSVYFSIDELCSGAGVYQMYSDNFKSKNVTAKERINKLVRGRGDDPRDQEMIKLGNKIFYKDIATIIVKKIKK